MISKEKIAAFQKHILDWYAENKRDLPWRDIPFDASIKARDPYKILISEVMSQQTQLSRVIPKYEAWLEKFPTVQSLTDAKVSEILHYWSGLGYNRRALNLQKLAQKIVTDYNGVFPQTEKELFTLPGIGPYTARAILCFAFDQQVAVIDTNVRKVILTQFFYESGIMNQESGQKKKRRDHHSLFLIHDSVRKSGISDKEIAVIAQTLLPHGRAYEWNQALMDYAAAVLKKEKIPIPKQSKFHGSHRYYRGQILKQLLAKKQIAVKDLGHLIKKDYSDLEEKWLKKLLEELEKEGFISIHEHYVSLSS